MLTEPKRELFDRIRPAGLDNQLGEALQQQVGLLVGKYSFAVQGGAVSTIKLLQDLGSANSYVSLPNGAIIKQVYIDIITACASGGGTGTIALTANSSGDLKAAVDADTLSGIVAGIPVGTAAAMVKLTAARDITVAIATEALTAGKFDVYIEWVMSHVRDAS